MYALHAPLCTADGDPPLRRRHYNPKIGRFARVDPYYGDPRRPSSFNKYAYVEADPIQGIDPSGWFFTYVGQLARTSVQSIIQSPYFVATANAYDKAQTFSDAIQLVGQFVATGTVNPALLAGLLASAVPFGSLLRKGKILTNNAADRITGTLTDVTDDLTDALRGLRSAGGKLDDQAVRLVGDLGAIGTARKLGFEAIEDFPTRYHGIDGLFRNGDRIVILEAKGGAGRLGSTAAGGQMSQGWIREKIEVLKRRGDHRWADELEQAAKAGRLDGLVVTTPVDRAAGTVGDPSFVLKAWDQIGEAAF